MTQLPIITFELTDYHIRTGSRGNCNMCPLAKALGPLLPSHEVEVYQGFVRVRKHWQGTSEGHTLQMSNALHLAVIDYDNAVTKALRPGSLVANFDTGIIDFA